MLREVVHAKCVLKESLWRRSVLQPTHIQKPSIQESGLTPLSLTFPILTFTSRVNFISLESPRMHPLLFKSTASYLAPGALSVPSRTANTLLPASIPAPSLTNTATVMFSKHKSERAIPE